MVWLFRTKWKSQLIVLRVKQFGIIEARTLCIWFCRIHTRPYHFIHFHVICAMWCGEQWALSINSRINNANHAIGKVWNGKWFILCIDPRVGTNESHNFSMLSLRIRSHWQQVLHCRGSTLQAFCSGNTRPYQVQAISSSDMRTRTRLRRWRLREWIRVCMCVVLCSKSVEMQFKGFRHALCTTFSVPVEIPMRNIHGKTLWKFKWNAFFATTNFMPYTWQHWCSTSTVDCRWCWCAIENAIKYVTQNWISSSAFDLTKWQPAIHWRAKLKMIKKNHMKNGREENLFRLDVGALVKLWREKKKSDHWENGRNEIEKISKRRKKMCYEISSMIMRSNSPRIIYTEKKKRSVRLASVRSVATKRKMRATSHTHAHSHKTNCPRAMFFIQRKD